MCISGAAVLAPHTVLDLAQESRLWAVSRAFVACLGLPSLRRCSVAPYGSRWTSTGPRGVCPQRRGAREAAPAVAPPWLPHPLRCTGGESAVVAWRSPRSLAAATFITTATIPTVCPSHDSASILSYQELPTSIQWWIGHDQEAKEDRRAGRAGWRKKCFQLPSRCFKLPNPRRHGRCRPRTARSWDRRAARGRRREDVVGNTNAATIMIGERVADLVREQLRLAA